MFFISASKMVLAGSLQPTNGYGS